MQEIFTNYISQSFGKHEQSLYKIKQFKANYKKYLPTDKNANILDIGSGRGEMLSCYKEYGYNNYLGIDLSPEVAEFCSSLNLNCMLISDTTEWLLNQNKKFACITLFDVIEHIKKNEVINFLKIIKKKLTPDGVLIVQTPNMQSPDAQLHRYNDITHEFGYSEHTLTQIFLAAGMDNFKFYGFEEFVNNNLKHKLAKMMRQFFWQTVRLKRRINTNLNPKILNPVFYAVVKNNNQHD
jgi:2-polyprenyl-3-methyl-5-hydroxy-6-metoxy-1,4-benzoquinol methylase